MKDTKSPRFLASLTARAGQCSLLSLHGPLEMLFLSFGNDCILKLLNCQHISDLAKIGQFSVLPGATNGAARSSRSSLKLILQWKYYNCHSILTSNTIISLCGLTERADLMVSETIYMQN